MLKLFVRCREGRGSAAGKYVVTGLEPATIRCMVYLVLYLALSVPREGNLPSFLLQDGTCSDHAGLLVAA